MQKRLTSQFLLDPDIHFLNHGSFGACPRPVFEELIAWQTRLERQPVLLLGREIAAEMRTTRHALADFVHCPEDDLVFFPNPTTAINMVVRNLHLGPGDEVLTTDHEYGAMDRTWRFMAEKQGFRYLNHPVPLPVTTHQDFVEQFWSGVTPATRVIFLSHITSQTALIFPVAEIIRRAQQAGILTIIDGAHVPGHIPLNLAELQPDIYTGACHKWLCAPKGAAFLYASPKIQPKLEPLVVSWGYQAEHPSSSQFVDYHEWQGTKDMSAYLTVPAAIRNWQSADWQAARASSREMAQEVRRELHALTGLEMICPDGAEWLGQMAAVPLPEVDVDAFKARLYDDYQVEVPVYRWGGRPFMRVSVQVYNTQADLDALVQGVKEILYGKRTA
ncbi:aminotransferase class V-fold PLP-dependent enzyme [bacterium]|nr:aminotransferase class V-fold PLP-dependent enzyme [bacterium]MCB2179240.1 aminotransferase class V-fold PLP-dependent enzyme [bacterium]